MTRSVFLLCAVVLMSQNILQAQNTEKTAVSKPAKSSHPRIRTGVVVKAEFTTEKPSAESASPVTKKSSPAWAVLTVALDPGRAASIFDYVLSRDGTEYACLDLADGDLPFEGKLRNYSSVDGKKCRLVFAIPSAEDEYELVFKLVSRYETPVKLNVRAPQEKKPEEK